MSQASQTNPMPPFSDQDESLRRFIWYSLALHIIALALYGVRAYVSPAERLPFEEVIRVDIVGLPDKTKPDADARQEPPPSPKPAPLDTTKPEAAKPELPKIAAATPKAETPKVNLNKNRRAQEAALKRLEAIERLKRAMSEAAPSAPAASQSQSTSDSKPQPLVKGNEVSRGSSLKGIAKLNYEDYQDKVHEHLRKFWNLPHWMANANLDAKIRVWIDTQGNILRKELTAKSTQPAFDERAMRALESATPLPPPPGGLANVLAVEGIEIEFVPER